MIIKHSFLLRAGAVAASETKEYRKQAHQHGKGPLDNTGYFGLPNIYNKTYARENTKSERLMERVSRFQL